MKKNHYLTIADVLEEHAPDIAGDIDEMRFEYDRADHKGDREGARRAALQLLENWQHALQELIKKIES